MPQYSVSVRLWADSSEEAVDLVLNAINESNLDDNDVEVVSYATRIKEEDNDEDEED